VRSSLLGVVAALLFLATVSPMVMIWGLENQKVDQCLELGGSFDYRQLRCDPTVDHPFVPFAERHPTLFRLAQAGLVAVVAVGGIALATGKRTGRTGAGSRRVEVAEDQE
jgi:hypothetical protein